jgi:hypothetical protein
MNSTPSTRHARDADERRLVRVHRRGHPRAAERSRSAGAAGLAFFVSSVGLALRGPLSGRLSVRFPAGIVMGVAVLLSAPALVLLAVAGPLPL